MIDRRGLLAGALALAALPVLAADQAASAASLLRPLTPPRDARALIWRDAEGGSGTFADRAGVPIILNLWAPWCLPCRREMPSLAALSRALAGHDAIVLPLAFDWRGPASIRRFYGEIGVTDLPILFGDGPNLMATLGLEDLPTTVIIDRDGMATQIVAGEARWDDPATLDWAKAL